MKRALKFFSLLSLLSSSLAALAAPAPLAIQHTLDLSDFRGRSFLESMLVKDGVKAQLDDDYITQYRFPSPEVVRNAVDHFDDKIVKRVKGAFNYDLQELDAFSAKIEGKTFTPETAVSVLRKYYNGSGNIYVLAHFFTMAAGGGTLIRLDDENYFYNVGYASGEESDDVKSGRSYGATPLHNANDASDVMYLNELERVIQDGQNLDGFYATMLDFLTKSDVRGLRELSPAAQAAATDLFTIYTAEVDRHIMVNLQPAIHPWENDLAEATFVGAFYGKIGRIYRDRSLVKAPLRDLWAMSSSGTGSGIGITRRDRRSLQKLVTTYLKSQHPVLVADLEQLVGDTRGDVFRGFMEYINHHDHLNEVNSHASELKRAMLAIVLQVHNDSSELVEFIDSY